MSVEGNPMILDAVKSFIKKLFMELYNNETVKLKHSYFTTFSQLTDTFYKEDEWPAAEEVEDYIQEKELFKGDEDNFDIDKFDRIKELFSFLYTELCFRHIFVHGKPLIHHRVESFENYLRLFEFLLNNSGEGMLPNLPLEWIADMMDEYLYQFEDFGSFRHQLGDLKEEELQDLEIIEEAANESGAKAVMFEVEETLTILRALSSHCDFSAATSHGTLWNLGYVSTLAISRIHVLVADYYNALQSLSHINIEDKMGIFTKLTSLHVTLFYYTGFAYLMMARYLDASILFSNILLAYRGVDRARIRTVCYADTQFQRKYEKIKKLCTIAATLNISQSIDDNVKSILLDQRNQNNETLLQKLRAANNSEDSVSKKITLLVEALKKNGPRFITPQKPDYKQIENKHKDTANIQAKWFLKSAETLLRIADLKSVLQMYSSISIEKLAELTQMKEREIQRHLILMKSKSQQFRRLGDSLESFGSKEGVTHQHSKGKYLIGSDIHFYIDNNVVFVDDKPQRQKFGDFFLQNATRLGKCTRDLKSTVRVSRGKRK